MHCIINIQIPHEVKKSMCVSLEDFTNYEKWTRCKYSNSKWYKAL